MMRLHKHRISKIKMLVLHCLGASKHDNAETPSPACDIFQPTDGDWVPMLHTEITPSCLLSVSFENSFLYATSQYC
jgi:hypothetical protein